MVINKLKSAHTVLFILKQLAVPFLFLAAALIAVTYYSFYTNKEQIQSNSYTSLNYFSYESESGISSVIKSLNFLEHDQAFISSLKSQSSDIDPDALYSTRETLKELERNFDIVDQIIIMNSESDYVITSKGITGMDDYLSSVYIYESYNSIFWKSIKVLSNSQYRVYSPSVVTQGDETKNIIPIAFKKIGSSNFDSLLVVNISLDTLLKSNESYKYTPNTKIFVLNKLNGEIFRIDSIQNSLTNDDDTLYNKLISGEKFFDFYFEDLGKCTVITASSSESLIGYTYFAAVPYGDVFVMQSSYILYVLLIVLLFLTFSAVTLLRSMHKLALPINQIAAMLHSDNGENIFENIKASANTLLKQNAKLHEALPFAQENYLINFLNSNETSENTDALNFLRESLPFKQDYFAVIVLQLSPTNLLYTNFNSEEYNTFRTGFYNIIRQTFSEKYSAFYLASEKGSLYIILNVNEKCQKSVIESELSDICSLLNNDTDYIICYTGLSDIHKDIEGLKIAHQEALHRLKVAPQSAPKIHLSLATEFHFDFSNADEQQLFTYLIGSSAKEAVEFVQKIVQKNENIDPRSTKQLYMQILNTIFRVARIKGISFEENKMDFEIYSELINQEPEEIYKKILFLTETTSLNSGKISSSAIASGDQVINYLNQNFTNSSLSLDTLAEQFNTTPSYISTVIKNKLGIGFSKYITNLRITEAMHLLKETEDNIIDIAFEAGFNSKQAFFRSFKTQVGMTPNEYRKQT